jgi:outer membrane biosynthesis protein TonB
MKPAEIKGVMTALGLTTSRMAELLGIPRATLRKYIDGTFMVPADIEKRFDEVAVQVTEGAAPATPGTSVPEEPAEGAAQETPPAEEVLEKHETAADAPKEPAASPEPKAEPQKAPAKKTEKAPVKRKLRYCIEVYEYEE